MGLNGSGKSTLLKLVAGLLYPTRDQVRVLGEPPGRATKARMAYMSEADSLFPWMSVGETLAFILKSAEPLLDRPVVLAGGRILLQGDVEELRRLHGRSVEQLVKEVLG